MGDDITAARQFSSRCQNKLRPILLTGQRDHKSVMETLDWIRMNADMISARAISRAAQTAMDEFDIPGLYPRGEHALLCLNKLVSQYTDGLNEIDDKDITQTLSFAEASDVEIDAFHTAKKLLSSLMHLSKSQNETSALSKLSAFEPANFNAPPSSLDSLDIIMPDITDETLRCARMQGKTVSLSYAAKDIFLQDGVSQTLQDGLIAICATLVSSTVKIANHDHSGAAHIAITAQHQKNSFDILVSCEGDCPPRSLFEEAPIAALSEYGAEFRLYGRDNLTFEEITNIPLWNSAHSSDVFEESLPLRRPA